MLKRLWFLFAQAVTVCLAIGFIVLTLKPEWLPIGPKTNTPIVSPITAQGSYRDAVARAMPTVVNIYTTKEVRRSQSPLLDDPFLKRFYGPRYNESEKQQSLGSGVIASQDGYILTNNHVVDSADQIEVAFEDGRKAKARLIGTDPETDLAVIKVDLTDLPAITFGDMDNVKVGDVVLAIGNPFGVGQTVTMGIISALGRNHVGINVYENFIQTDAAINPGNSGGALIDARGMLLGINSAMYSGNGGSLGIGFAIPVTTVKQVMDAIITDGQVIRGWLGIEPREITSEMADSLGLSQKDGIIIVAVVKGGPAEVADIKPGDILVSIDGKKMKAVAELFQNVAKLKPSQAISVVISRNGTEMTKNVTAGKRPIKRRIESANP